MESEALHRQTSCRGRGAHLPNLWCPGPRCLPRTTSVQLFVFRGRLRERRELRKMCGNRVLEQPFHSS